MIKLSNFISFALLLVPAASKIYTGFDYGAFWGETTNVKTLDDFRAGFGYAKNLTAAIPFDSARLFSCRTQGSENNPTKAFDAAVETKTNLLLGFWLSGPSLDDNIRNELSALGKGFAKHGQALADLVIGLSVGSEDVYRFANRLDSGLSRPNVVASIKKVRQEIASSDFGKYMKGKPIGHFDRAEHSVVEGADFYGMTAYSYWQNNTIEKGKESFLETLEGIKQRAGNTPVWIGEMGCPFEGVQRGEAAANMENLQTFWTEVGCYVVGMYTTFWFELIRYPELDQPDWAILDGTKHKPRIDLSCPWMSQPSPPAAPSANSSSGYPASSSRDPPSILAPSSPNYRPTVHVANTIMKTVQSSLGPASLSPHTSTTHVTTTIMVTVEPTPSSSNQIAPEGVDEEDHEVEKDVTITLTSTKYVKPSHSASPKKGSHIASAKPFATRRALPPEKVTPASNPSALPINTPWCVTVADIAWNGQYVPVDGHPAGADGKCALPPIYSGLPYGGSKTLAPQSPPTSKAEVAPTPPAAQSVKSKVVANSPALPPPAAVSSADASTPLNKASKHELIACFHIDPGYASCDVEC